MHDYTTMFDYSTIRSESPLSRQQGAADQLKEDVARTIQALDLADDINEIALEVLRELQQELNQEHQLFQTPIHRSDS